MTCTPPCSLINLNSRQYGSFLHLSFLLSFNTRPGFLILNNQIVVAMSAASAGTASTWREPTKDDKPSK